jgi:hypothetical protein
MYRPSSLMDMVLDPFFGGNIFGQQNNNRFNNQPNNIFGNQPNRGNFHQ